jgi:hypothetical protein
MPPAYFRCAIGTGDSRGASDPYFERFHQAHAEAHRSGTGLGLHQP